MTFETKISVPTRDLGRLTAFLLKAGCVVLDAGERTTTDDGVGAEASVNVLFLQEPALEVAPIGVRT